MTSPSNSRKQWYQTAAGSHVPWFLGGFIVVGSILDTISNAYALVTPRVALVCLLVVTGATILVHVYLRRHPLSWLAVGGQRARITRFGPRIVLCILGALFAINLPLLFPKDEALRATAGSESVPTYQIVSSEHAVPVSELFEEREMEQRGGNGIIAYSVKYPQLRDGTIGNAGEFNRLVQSVVYRYIREYSTTAVFIEYDCFYRNGFVAVSFDIVYEGGAHPQTSFDNFAFDLRRGEVVELGDLVEESFPLYDALDRQLRSDRALTFEPTDGEFPVSVEVDKQIEKGWHVSDEGLIVSFDQCSIEACAGGPVSVFVPYAKLRPIMSDRFKHILSSRAGAIRAGQCTRSDPADEVE